MELESVKKIMGDHDGVILQFRGDGETHSEDAEYLIIVTEEEDLEDCLDPVPGYCLVEAIPIDSENLDTLPCNRILATR